jgi:hypothetical protein
MNQHDFLRGHPVSYADTNGCRRIAQFKRCTQTGLHYVLIKTTVGTICARPIMGATEAAAWFETILPWVEHPDRWQVGSNGAGKLHWFIFRDPLHENGPAFFRGRDILKNTAGRLRRFASRETAEQAMKNEKICSEEKWTLK